MQAGPDAVTTLAVDCGGSGIKGSVLDASATMLAKRLRVRTPYPLPPQRFLEVLRGLADGLPRADRATVGMPGMIRHGVVVRTPHYVTRRGPQSHVDPALLEQWHGFPAQREIERALGMPTLVMNDAEVHGAGLIAGVGSELVLTLGTGLGCALFDAGCLAPHLELSQAPAPSGGTYDAYLGDQARRRLGDRHWSRRVLRALQTLEPVFVWDRVYLGGGNSRRITPEVLAALQLPPTGDLAAEADRHDGPRRVVVVPNSAGITGGVRAWELLG